jgi:hypothetical protein
MGEVQSATSFMRGGDGGEGEGEGEREECRIREEGCRIEALPFLYKLRGELGAWIPHT